MLPGMTPPGAPFSGVVREVSLSLSSVNSVFFVAASLDVSEMSAKLKTQILILNNHKHSTIFKRKSIKTQRSNKT